MPCNSDHLEATQHEVESRRVSGFIVHLMKHMNEEPPTWIVEASTAYYGEPEKIHELTAMLCDLCVTAPTTAIYNAHDRTARSLADWWEDHQEVDAKKAAEAERLAREERTKQRAAAKLTTEEKRVLGV